MDPGKFIELQKQMQENNTELYDFMKDIGSWKHEVDRKSARLMQTTEHDNSDIPAIRNSLLRKHRKKKKPLRPILRTKHSQSDRIRSYDYRAWDNFDVDKALEEVDRTEEQGVCEGSTSSSETDEELERQRRCRLSAEARELGNIRFKEGRYEEAVEQYTLAVRLTPEDPLAYTNRAFAFLRLDRHSSAEADCSSALALDAGCMKALYRRSLARKALGATEAAIEDLRTILRLDSTNKAALNALIGLLPADSPKVAAERTSPAATGDMNGCRRRGRRCHTAMRRIPIAEVGGVEVGIRGAGKLPLPTETSVLSSSLSSSPKHGNNCISSSFLSTSQPFLGSSVSACTNGAEKHDLQTVRTTSTTATIGSNAPSNWFQLERQLRELVTKQDGSTASGKQSLSEAGVNFLLAIPPEQYDKVIGQNLEASLLANLLRAYHLRVTALPIDRLTVKDKLDVLQRLHALSRLPRFGIAWLMADQLEHQLFDQILQCLQATSDTNRNEELVALIDQIKLLYL